MAITLVLPTTIAGEQYTRAVLLALAYAPEPPFTSGPAATTAPCTTAWRRALYDRAWPQ